MVINLAYCVPLSWYTCTVRCRSYVLIIHVYLITVYWLVQ